MNLFVDLSHRLNSFGDLLDMEVLTIFFSSCAPNNLQEGSVAQPAFSGELFFWFGST